MSEPRKLRAIDLIDAETLKRELGKIDRLIEQVVIDNPAATSAALHSLSITAIRNNGLEAGDAYIPRGSAQADGTARARAVMTAASIPLDELGAPDLQLLMRELGGYANITPETWAAFDAAMAAYRAERHSILAPGAASSQAGAR
jgi:hypothetical protein